MLNLLSPRKALYRQGSWFWNYYPLPSNVVMSDELYSSCPTPTEEQCFTVTSVDIGSSSDFFRSGLALPIANFICVCALSWPLAETWWAWRGEGRASTLVLLFYDVLNHHADRAQSCI